MTRSWRVALALVIPLALVVGAPVFAQEPPPADAATDAGDDADAATADQESADEALAAGVLEYMRGNYRDPFRSLEEKQKPLEEEVRPPGPAGMLIEEIDLVGVLSGPKGTMVLIIGPDGLGYSLTEGADLYDGKVLRIDSAQGVVVFRQEVNDPNRIKPYRDIERRLDTAS